jgi:hypothetical protein
MNGFTKVKPDHIKLCGVHLFWAQNQRGYAVRTMVATTHDCEHAGCDRKAIYSCRRTDKHNLMTVES